MVSFVYALFTWDSPVVEVQCAMFNDIFKIVISFVYWCIIIKLSPYIVRFNHELGRKFVHLFVSFWWFFVLYFFDNMWSALVVPVIFIAINTHATFNKKAGFVSSLNREKGSISYGLICYPIGFVIIIVAAFCLFECKDTAGLAVMTMGFGDTGAAIIGSKYSWMPFTIKESKKSLSGIIGMFTFTFVSTIIYSLIYSFKWPLLVALACSAVGCVVEAISIKGSDNVTVPLSIIILSLLMF